MAKKKVFHARYPEVAAMLQTAFREKLEVGWICSSVDTLPYTTDFDRLYEPIKKAIPDITERELFMIAMNERKNFKMNVSKEGEAFRQRRWTEEYKECVAQAYESRVASKEITHSVDKIMYTHEFELVYQAVLAQHECTKNDVLRCMMNVRKHGGRCLAPGEKRRKKPAKINRKKRTAEA